VPRNPYMKTFLALLVTIATNQVVSAQLVSIGAKGGVPFLDDSKGGDESRPYIVGPSVEFRLPAGFAIEVDALYRRVGSTSQFGLLGTFIASGTSMVPFPIVSSYIDRQRGNYWEFPVLGKYYFRPRTTAWQPFVGTGWALRTVAFHEDITETVTDTNGNSKPNSFRNHYRSDVGAGAVVAAGIRFHVGRLSVSPELRYTYWGSTAQFALRRNEAAGLLGISF
jgi:hypothetical protein